MFKPTKTIPIIINDSLCRLSDNKPQLTLNENAIIAIAEVNGFNKEIDGWTYYDACEASALLEIREKIWMYPDSNYVTWTVKFRTIEQLRLFELKYSEYL